MKKVQFGVLLLLLGLMLGVIVACGGETPTNTPLPPTNTVVPPTNTPLPPTNTAVPPTNTTVAAAAPTNTASSSLPATTTTGGGTTNPADAALISDAITATKNLKSYHAVVIGSGDVFTQPVNLEGDFVAPDQAHLTGTSGGQQVELLRTGGKTYAKDPSGQWYIQPEGGTGSSSGNPINLSADNTNILGSLEPLISGGTQFQNLGQDTVNGVSVTHFSGNLDLGAMMGGGATPPGVNGGMSLGTVELWIDPNTKYIHKLTMALDLTPLMQILQQMAEAFGGTPGPGTPTATPLPASMKANISITVSKHNDSSITIPAAPANAIPAPTVPPIAGLGGDVEATMTAVSGMIGGGDVEATMTAVSGMMGGAEATITAMAGGGSDTTPVASGPTHKVGESATVAKFNVTVKGLQEVSSGNGLSPSDGNRWVGVQVSFKNTSGDQGTVSATLEASLTDSSGASYDSSLTGSAASGLQMAEATVTADGTLDSVIVFEVPKDAKGFKFTYKDFATDASATWDLGQ